MKAKTAQTKPSDAAEPSDGDEWIYLEDLRFMDIQAMASENHTYELVRLDEVFVC